MEQKRYIWLTDTHFNFLDPKELNAFYQELRATPADGIFLTGDISTGPFLIEHLTALQQSTKLPVFFILGNHDYYRVYINDIQKKVKYLTEHNPQLHYLTTNRPIALNSNSVLIGHDGWYDAKWREPLTPFIFMWDWYYIKDFRALFGIAERIEFMRDLAAKASEDILNKLNKVIKQYSTIYLLTHFPPWPEESDRYFGLIEKFWKPYNSCKTMADTLINFMADHPDKKLIVLAGHTHLKRQVQITPNIELRVGDAEFGKPQIQDIILI